MFRKITTLSMLISLAACSGGAKGPADPLALASLAKVGKVDERYQSYNVEMVEVTGGRFWAPYGGPADEMYRQREPLDLGNPRLRALAKHLAPAYMRVSGTWANDTYLPAADDKRTAPPPGFRQLLTRDQWRGVVSFSNAVDAPIVMSFAVSSGTRGTDGRWLPAQAQRFAELTAEAGGVIHAAEFFNEPNVPGAVPTMPKDYDAAAYGADFRIFRDWARKSLPQMLILGPGGVGEGSLTKDIPVNVLGGKMVRSEDMLAANPGSVDALSYHFYGSVSQRCAAMNIGTAAKDEALAPRWLDKTLEDYNFYLALRDKYEPGKPMWLTETAQAACGGSSWASSFLDSFRYLNQLGLLAQRGVQVVMHNTLSASDYALIDEQTLEPRPNYWAAVLWRKLMDRTVLAAPASPAPELRLYAHCLRGTPGGVAVLALNLGEVQQTLPIGAAANLWLLTAAPLDAKTLQVNGRQPSLDARGDLQSLDSVAVSGEVRLPAQSIAFLAIADAGNPACLAAS